MGGIALAPGYLPRHAVIYLYAAFITIGLFAFVSYMQPYLLTVNLGLPAHLQGRTVSALNFANELLALCLVAPFGALADKIGRRSVYAFGFLWLAAGFLLYPLARTVPQLTGCALFFSVGVAAIGTMLGTVLADTPAEASRGRLVGLAGFFQGLGAAALVLVLGQMPKRLTDAGFDALTAGRITLWLAAALCAVSAVVVFAGLKRGTPSERAPAMPLNRILADGARRGAAQSAHLVRLPAAVRLLRRSRGARHVPHAAPAAGLARTELQHGRRRRPRAAAVRGGDGRGPCHRAHRRRAARSRGSPAHRRGRHGARAAAYLLCGFVDDPTQDVLMAAVAALLGVGQIAAIIAGQTLLGQEAPRDVRGAVFGLAGICASAGILFTNAFGGWLYDSVSKGGPFFLLAGVNFAIFLFGVRLPRTCLVDRVDQQQRRAFGRAQQRAVRGSRPRGSSSDIATSSDTQALDALAHVRRGEHQHGLIQRARTMHGEIEVIAGHRHAHVGRVGFVERDEPERLPEFAHRLELRRRQAVLGEVAAQRTLAAVAVAGEMCGRFLHAHRLAGRIEKAELVERIVADAFPRDLDAELFDDVRVLRDARVHVGDAWATET